MDANDLLAAAYIYDEFFIEKDNALNWLDSKGKRLDAVDASIKNVDYFALPMFGGWSI